MQALSHTNIANVNEPLLALAIRTISICIALPKVAKASTIVTVARRCRWHFHLKMLPMETRANGPK